MLGEEVRHQPVPKEPPTRAENLISIIIARLGSHYYLGSHAKNVPVNGAGLLLYREVSFVRRGLFGLDNQRFGGYTLLTLITDSQPIREIEQQSKTREMLSTPPTRIDGWMPQDGRHLVDQTVEPDDIPADVRAELTGIAYYATAERFTYISQRLSAQVFLADKLTKTTRG